MKAQTPDFDRIAPYHDRIARLVFGSAWNRSQNCFLEETAPCSRILALGGGTGAWLPSLLDKNTQGEIWYVDSSHAMISLARKRTADPRVHFTHDRVESFHKNDVDCTITLYFLDIFSENEIGGVIAKVASQMKPGAIWIATDFVATRWWHRPFLFIMYRFFLFVANLSNQKLPDWQKAIEANGFTLLQKKTFYSSFIHAAMFRKD